MNCKRCGSESGDREYCIDCDMESIELEDIAYGRGY